MYQQSASKMYAQIDVESEILNASPYQLIQILFNGALSALRRALILMEQGNIAGKGENISKAINIIGNGLKQGLDKEKGEDLAENLALLYDYMITQLLDANLKNNPEKIHEVIKLLTEISDAWQQIGTQINSY